MFFRIITWHIKYTDEYYINTRDVSTCWKRAISMYSFFSFKYSMYDIEFYFSIDIISACVANRAYTFWICSLFQRPSGGQRVEDVKCASTERCRRRSGTNLPSIFPVIYHRTVLLFARSHISRSCSHNGSSHVVLRLENRDVDLFISVRQRLNISTINCAITTLTRPDSSALSRISRVIAVFSRLKQNQLK